MYDFTKKSCEEFVDVLGSNAPVPGGGGASAMVGAIGTALGNMVASLTMGYKKYADIKDEMAGLKEQCKALQDRLLAQVEQDAVGFEPLSRAYRLPADDPNRPQIMEEATLQALQAPMDIMITCCQALDVIQVLAKKGAKLAISDAGCGAICCKAALQSASLNVFINTKSLKNREKAADLEKQANDMLDKYCPLADELFRIVQESL